jgi:drug/metabolite transporter (DMT)-like permease
MAAVLFGLSTPLAKGLLTFVLPQVLAGLFYLGSGIGLVLLRRIQSGTIGREAPLNRIDLPWLSGAVVFGGIAAPVLLLTGLQQTPASDASLLLNLEAVFTVILAWAVFHESLGRRVGAGIAAVLLGGVLISWQPTAISGGVLGPLMIGMACLCWGIDNNLTQRISAGDPREVAAIKGLVAGTVNISLGIWLGGSLPSPTWTAVALTVGFFTYGLSLMFYVLALRSLGTARTGAYFSAGPFIGGLVALVLWRESATLSLGVASVAMVAGVWLLLSERHIHSHVHEAFAHSHRHVHDEHHQHKHGPLDPTGEPHNHLHEHELIAHSHSHYPDIHHRHSHGREKTAEESA